MARTIVVAVFLGFCLLALLGVIPRGHGPWLVALASACLLAMLGLQVLYFSRLSTPQRSKTTYLMLAAQACLAFLPLWLFGYTWDGMPAMFAGTALLILPPVLAWPAFGGSVVVAALVEASGTGSALMGWYVAVGVPAFALEVWGLTRLAWVITELHEARSELAKAAVAHERLRFARDLHEMLGLALSAISQKGELARRLIVKSPERARHELSEILDMARRALSDVRTVARGYRELNLDEASRTAGSVLAASSVDVRMELNHGDLPVPVRTQLAMVLREGVTNVLLHSRAERCEIELHQAGDTVTLDIVNDGIDRDTELGAQLEGGGIAKLARAVADAGGSLTSGVDPDGRFRLHVSVPVAAPHPPRDDASYEQVPRGETFLVRAVLISVLCGHFLQSCLRLATLVPDVGDIALGVAYMSLMLVIQLFHFSRPGVQLRSPRSYLLLAVLAVLTCLPLLQFGVPWLALLGFLIASVLLVLPSVSSWGALAVLLLLAGVLQSSAGATPTGIFYNLMGAMMIGLAVYALTWMVRMVAELRAARIQLAEAAVAEERLRFARDLHDLLGLSLSAITLKSELAHRLVLVDPDRANEQLTEILSIARLALADVPSVAAGYRELSLDEEFRSAESLLSAIDVDVRLVQDYGELPRPVGTVLATVLREAVTNVLRHSKGEWCEIALRKQNGEVVLEVVNDGVTDDPGVTPAGNGIHNLSARVATFGGELSVGVEDEGTFHLKAVVPI